MLLIKSNVDDSEIHKLVCDSKYFSKDKIDSESQANINVKLHDSQIETEKLYEELVKVDLESAQKIHPNDRRKLCRYIYMFTIIIFFVNA